MEVKERILVKADELFCRYGIRSVSMDDIAGQLGMSKKTLYQFFADKERYWPSGRGLHHGRASDIQLKMEELARGTILEEDVRHALEEGRGWLAESLPRLTKDRKRLTNLCAPCPRGCFKRKAPLPKGIHRKKHPIIRGNCREKGLIHSIIRLEFDRRRCEAEFWNGHPRKVCCGTMVNCPLARDLQ